MTDDEVRRFLANYTPADEPSIRFEGNGEEGDDLEDRNQGLREEVLEAALEDLDAVPIELVRDLYRAETCYSAYAWCISGDVGQLGEHLPRRGGDRFIEDDLEGREQSFDAMMGSSFSCDRRLAEHLLGVVRDRLRTEADEERARLLRAGEELFREWAASRRSGPE